MTDQKIKLTDCSEFNFGAGKISLKKNSQHRKVKFKNKSQSNDSSVRKHTTPRKNIIISL